ncbi:MAG: ABC transporter ATP-binding protein [Oscillospiraceae bacterium]
MSLLTIRDLRVLYGQTEAIHGVSMSIEPNSITAIIGSNGAGKTTILNAVSGIINSTGDISYNGKPIARKSSKIVKSGIIQVPEGRKIFAGLSVEENLRIGAFSQKMDKSFNKLLDEQYELFPRLRERKKQDAGTLSGGEQQMLAICRGLMARPKLLLLDEPSLGLAPVIVNEVFKLIEDIKNKGVTIMLVEQNAMKSLKISDYAYVIENGNIVKEGSGSSMLNDQEVASAYLGTSRK